MIDSSCAGQLCLPTGAWIRGGIHPSTGASCRGWRRLRSGDSPRTFRSARRAREGLVVGARTASRNADHCDEGQDLGSVQEGGELPARSEARGSVRCLHVHVSALTPWWVQARARPRPGFRLKGTQTIEHRRDQCVRTILKGTETRIGPRDQAPWLTPLHPHVVVFGGIST
jgi:hypothetical protein